MTVDEASSGELMLRRLLAAAHIANPEDLPDLVAEHAAPAGLAEPAIFLADLQQDRLVPLGSRHQPVGEEPLEIESTLAGRAFRDGVVREATNGARHLWLPLLNGADRIGVLRVEVPAYDDAVRARAGQLASLVALLLVSKQVYADRYAAAVRTREMTLPAEMQWSLLPPLTFATDRVVISGMLEPAYEIAGDSFDYGITGDVVHIALFDAMGHTMGSGLIVGTAMSACRHGRRTGMKLPEISEAIDAAVRDQFGAKRFVTGILARLDTTTGKLVWVTRGHPAPLLLRDGKWIQTLDRKPAPPMGFGLDADVSEWEAQLQPGDRLLFYTDGVTEARDADGNFFGLDRFADFVIRKESDGLSAPETLRRLVRAIMSHQGGRLQDDATVLLVEWRSGEELLP